MPIRYARLISLLLVLAAPTGVLANPFEQQLANGLRIIVKEDHRAPTAAHMVWYHAGSMDETNGTTGVAHLLEHMMFKGTPSTGAGEFSRLVAAEGGRDNAFTSRPKDEVTTSPGNQPVSTEVSSHSTPSTVSTQRAPKRSPTRPPGNWNNA